MEVPDYSFISKDTGPSLSQSIGNWQGITKNALEIQDKQADQAIGGILQQSTDVQGNVDYGKANALAAQAGPRVQLGMSRMLAANSARRGEQISQASDLYGLAGKLAASASADPSDENMAKIRAQAVAFGAPASALAEIDRITALPMNQRSAEALKHSLGAIDALQRLHIQMGAEPFSVDAGGNVVFGSRNPIFGAFTPSGTSVTKSLDPGQATAIDKIDIGGGQTIQVPHASAGDLLRANPGWRAIVAPTPSTPSTTPPPPPKNTTVVPTPSTGSTVPTGRPGGPGTYQGPGFGVMGGAPGPGASIGGGPVIASADPSFAPGVGSAAPPSPAVAGDVSAIMAGMNQARATPSGGTQTAFNALQGGGVPPATAVPAAPPPAEAVAGAAGAAAVAKAKATGQTVPVGGGSSLVAYPDGRIATPPTLGVSASPAQIRAGEKTGEQSATMGGTLVSRGDQAPVQKANLQNMLTDLAKLDTMGPGTEKEVFLNSVMQKLTGYGFSMNRDQVAAGNSFAKLANIAVGQQLAAMGGTDARQQLFMGSNPHLDLSKLGNERIIHMLMGNEDAIQAKARAWTEWAQSNGTDTYQKFQDDFNRHFDPRVFQSQYMERGGPELKALQATVEREGDDAVKKFKEDTLYARSHRWIQ